MSWPVGWQATDRGADTWVPRVREQKSSTGQVEEAAKATEASRKRDAMVKMRKGVDVELSGMDWVLVKWSRMERHRWSTLVSLGAMSWTARAGQICKMLQVWYIIMIYYDMLSMAIGIGQQWFPQKAH